MASKVKEFMTNQTNKQITLKSFCPSRWFKLEANPLTKQEDFVFAGGFWDRNYNNLDLDLF